MQGKVIGVSSGAATYLKRSADLQRSFDALQSCKALCQSRCCFLTLSIGSPSNAEIVPPRLGGIELPHKKIVALAEAAGP
jgi:hypothetical protein